MVTAKVAAGYSISIIASAVVAVGVTWGILQATRRIQWWHSLGRKLSFSDCGQSLRALVRAFAAVAAGGSVLVAFQIRPGVGFVCSVAFLLLAKDLLSIHLFRYGSAPLFAGRC